MEAHMPPSPGARESARELGSPESVSYTSGNSNTAARDYMCELRSPCRAHLGSIPAMGGASDLRLCSFPAARQHQLQRGAGAGRSFGVSSSARGLMITSGTRASSSSGLKFGGHLSKKAAHVPALAPVPAASLISTSLVPAGRSVEVWYTWYVDGISMMRFVTLTDGFQDRDVCDLREMIYAEEENGFEDCRAVVSSDLELWMDGERMELQLQLGKVFGIYDKEQASDFVILVTPNGATCSDTSFTSVPVRLDYTTEWGQGDK